mgnify:CR=1 FL=1
MNIRIAPVIMTINGVIIHNDEALVVAAGIIIEEIPNMTPTSAPRERTKWKCATTKYVSWREESSHKFARNKPVKPPDTKNKIPR